MPNSARSDIPRLVTRAGTVRTTRATGARRATRDSPPTHHTPMPASLAGLSSTHYLTIARRSSGTATARPIVPRLTLIHRRHPAVSRSHRALRAQTPSPSLGQLRRKQQTTHGGPNPCFPPPLVEKIPGYRYGASLRRSGASLPLTIVTSAGKRAGLPLVRPSALQIKTLRAPPRMSSQQRLLTGSIANPFRPRPRPPLPHVATTLPHANSAPNDGIPWPVKVSPNLCHLV